jgi:fission process protein 1
MNSTDLKIPSAINGKRLDIWRESPLRYLGYANELGESFRPLFPKYVLPSYVIAFAYVGCDTVDKTYACYQKDKNVISAIKTGGDALLWQTLASVFIPGGVIRVVTSSSTQVFNSQFLIKNLHPNVIKWSPTMIGLSAIPFIIHPIDKLVDTMMDNSVRKWI